MAETNGVDRAPLTRDEVVRAIERRGPRRVPMTIHQWNPPEHFGDRAEAVREIQRRYPSDTFTVVPRMPRDWNEVEDPDHVPGYSWMPTPPPPPIDAVHGLDANVAIRDWRQLDDILAYWPDPDILELFAGQHEHIAENSDGRYTLMHWWYCFYERLWSLRGMENALCDLHTEPRAIHAFLDALADFYCAVIRRAATELQVDAIYTTDDIGMQTGPMFSPAVFREFFRPRYKRLIDTAHEHGLHFWLHTCGNVTAFLDDFVELGLDVIHPIQKYTMDEREVAARYGGKLCFWAGMDVQQVLPNGTPDDVRREVRFLIDAYDGPGGGCMITAGNAITADVPLANLEAFYDETLRYGTAHRGRALTP